MSNKRLGFITSSNVDLQRATMFLTISRSEGEKVHVAPGEVIQEKLDEAKRDAYWAKQAEYKYR